MTAGLISIVVPALNEARNLDALHRAIDDVFRGDLCDYAVELIIVDDGSTHDTRDVIARIVRTDPRVRGVHLARNFGHQYALLAGIEEAQGDAVVTMDADLEQPPEAIARMVALWEQGVQVVHGVRRDRPELGLFKKWSSRAFYRVFRFLSRIPMEPGMLDFRLLDRQVVDAVLAMTETDFFLRGIAAWVGFTQQRIPYDAGLRAHGKTRFSIPRMVNFAVSGITSFSVFPLRLATWLGVLMTISSLLYGTVVGIRHFFQSNPQPGYASTILLISFLMGVQFLLIGTLGEYVARIHIEVKRRPRYIVASRSGHRPADDGAAPVRLTPAVVPGDRMRRGHLPR